MSKVSVAVKDPELETLETPEPEEEVELERKPRNKGKNWVMTPARAESLKKAQAKLKEKNDLKRQEQLIAEEESRKVIEQKVIAKAIALKKRQLKKEEAIDSIPVGPLRPRREVEAYVPKYRFL